MPSRHTKKYIQIETPSQAVNTCTACCRNMLPTSGARAEQREGRHKLIGTRPVRQRGDVNLTDEQRQQQQ